MLLADGSKVYVDLLPCSIRKLIADQPKSVMWELPGPGTWLIEEGAAVSEQFPVINDAMCDFTCTNAAREARAEWVSRGGKQFPTEAEAVETLRAAVETVDNEPSCKVAQAALDWLDTTDGTRHSKHAGFLDNLTRLMQVYQKGSMLHDACHLLKTVFNTP